MTRALEWWQKAVFYQIYPRSFADSNGDGIGDLRGIIDKLDHLRWLGVDGIWLNPTMPSPNRDWGYDVSDYCDVHPELGTMQDLDELVEAAAGRGIRVLLDLVPNHTSSEHAWFKDASSGKDARHRDYYVWADPRSDGSPPNNWLSVFGGDAWEYHEPTGQFYLHNFLESQADLNWWNEHVRAAIDDVFRFWYDRGVAGFRIDVAHAVIKDARLRDNLPSTPDDHPRIQRLGQQHTYSMDQPEVHDVIRRWRKLSDGYDEPRILVGETFLLDLARMAAYYGTGDELHLAFNFPFIFCDFDASLLRQTVELTEELLPEIAWPVWTGSNHDVLRFPSRWCKGHDDRIRLGLVMILTMRGTPFLYYGDELGMTDVSIPRDELKDPVGVRFWPENKGRDSCRTPMQWGPGRGAGFTSRDATPWLRLGDNERRNVADQRGRPDSILSLTRDLIAVRKGSNDLTVGAYGSVDSPEGTWVYRRGTATLVALNISAETQTVAGIEGRLVLGTARARAGEVIRESLELKPWEGAIIDTRRETT